MAVPQRLKFLEPFIQIFDSMPAEDVENSEHIDLLDSLLRDYVAGTPTDEVDAKIGALFESVVEWLAESPTDNEAALFLKGFLLFPDLGQDLLQPPTRGSECPTISFDAPSGWVVDRVPFRLDLSSGEVNASITAIDELSFDIFPMQMEAGVPAPHLKASRSSSEVCWDTCRGNKFVYLEEGTKTWKRVDYVLSVPGGFVSVWMGTESGDNFDEMPLESQLRTITLDYGGEEVL